MTILFIIVFIAELIITQYIITYLLKLDKKILDFNDLVQESKKPVGEIASIACKISEQFIELAEEFSIEFKKQQEDIIYKFLNKILIMLLLYRINIKPLNKFRKTKVGKSLIKGFSIVKSMV